eukprot:TRINITY_DN281_c0_g1_i1.p3 TRINITY_DN281_c0_g1~~TRINITY_DN281_c0_g1_i1.p3  ORF type:complete len:187 (+),score=26.37 TRINITY_DN281_c0_g1_i1:676-1236(+)
MPYRKQRPVKEGIELIGVVRKKEAAEKLREMGMKYALDSSDLNFEQNLKEVCEKTGAKLCFDAVSGELTGKLLKALPPTSRVYLYGMLGGELTGVNPILLILNQQKIQGFSTMFANFIGKYEDRVKKFEYVLDNLKKGGKTFITQAAKTYKLEDCKEAMDKFKELAGKGKSIFIPNQRIQGFIAVL